MLVIYNIYNISIYIYIDMYNNFLIHLLDILYIHIS